MLNFSGLSSSVYFGRVARLPLRLIPSSAVFRVIQGRMKGMRWIVGAGTHGCWLGSYELPKQNRFAIEVKEGRVVYDVGANSGFYTLLAARCVGARGRVHAFEPAPENLSFLRRHVALNRLSNTTINALAISDASGTLHFRRGPNRSTGRLDDAGDLEVKAMSIDDFVLIEGHSPPDVIKIDVEGGEARVLRGARGVLQAFRPTLFLATHGSQVHDDCCAL